MRPAISLVLSLLLAADAAAEPLFRRQGSLGWSFDEIALETPQGTRRRSQWSQAYELSVDGPLVHRLAGDLSTSAAFKDGFNVSQAVNTESPAQKTASWSARGDLFPFDFRRWARFAPNYSWSENRQASAASAPERVIRSDSWGFSGGLSLPRLPAFSVARQRSLRNDPVAGGAIRELAENSRESVSWALGALRLSADRDLNEVTDLTAGRPALETETRRADLEVRTGIKKTLGLQFFALRSSAYAQKVSGVTAQEDVTANLAVRTLPLKAAGWAHEVSYGNDYTRANLTGAQTDSSSLSVLSNRERRWGWLTSVMNGGQSHIGGASRSLAESLSVGQRLLGRRLTLQESVSGGWSEGAGGQTTRSDAASLRATLSPGGERSLTAEVDTAGVEQLGGGGASRTHKGALFGNVALRRSLRASGRAEHVRASVPKEGLLTETDSLSASLEGDLRRDLSASALFLFTRTRSSRSRGTESPSGSLGLAWSPLASLSVNVRASSAGESANVYLGAAWTAGRTTLRAYLERREISTPQGFSHFNVALTRTF